MTETQEITAALSATLTEAAFQADRLASFGDIDGTHRQRLAAMAEVLRAEVRCLPRLVRTEPAVTRGGVTSKLVAAALALVVLVAPLRAQTPAMVATGGAGNGGRVEEIVTDSVPDNDNAQTKCAQEEDGTTYPITYLSNKLVGSALVEVRAHEKKHREQLDSIAAGQKGWGCAEAMKYIHGSPWIQAQMEIEASCTGYRAVHLPYGDQHRTLLGVFQHFARQGVDLEVLSGLALKYCDQEPYGVIKQSIAYTPPPRGTFHRRKR